MGLVRMASADSLQEPVPGLIRITSLPFQVAEVDHRHRCRIRVASADRFQEPMSGLIQIALLLFHVAEVNHR